jgi:preprotein translocase SecE subunit
MTIDNQRLLQYVMYGLGLVLWFVLWRFIAGMASVVLMALNRTEPEYLRMILALVAVGLTAFIVEFARHHPVASKFGMEVLSEMRKVSWPSWKDVKGATIVSLSVMFVVSFFMFAFDSFYAFMIKIIYQSGS